VTPLARADIDDCAEHKKIVSDANRIERNSRSISELTMTIMAGAVDHEHAARTGFTASLNDSFAGAPIVRAGRSARSPVRRFGARCA
jgi:hypothetical protein